MHQNNTLRHLTALILTYVLFVTFLPAATFAQDKTDENAPQTVFSNTAPITINSVPPLTAPTTAVPYPSTLNVSGMSGTITRLAISLRGLTHSRASDLDFLLVGPTGAKYVFLSDTGSNFSFEDGVFTFADDAFSTVPNPSAPPIVPGVFRPSVGFGTNTFPAPAPAGPYNTGSTTIGSVFNGTDPNGTWSLYIVDDSLNLSGSINSGWSLSITTNGAPQIFSNSNYIEVPDYTTRATPYGSEIAVSGLSGVITNIKVTISGFSHAASSDVDILLVSPNGKGLILLSDAGNGAATNVDLTFDDAAASTISTVSAITSGTYKPTDIQTFTSPTSANEDTFPNPAPLRPYNSSSNNLLSYFNGFSPNGTWSLFVVDDLGANAGQISGGWSLDITTAPLQLPPLGCASAFFNPTNFSVGVSPTGLATGDFNNDMNPDLVVTNQVSNNISILLGNGNGTFMPQSQVNVGSGPYAVAVGLLNNDTNQDLAVVNSTSNNVSILFGNGNGTFGTPTNFTVGANPISISIGDVNNDSKPDLAIANFGGFFFGSVSILLNNGSGGFNAPLTVRTRTQPSFVKLENINSDTSLDLVVTSFGSNSASIFFGTGNGNFQLSQNLNTGAGPVSADLYDANSDGVKDLVVVNYNSDSVTTFLGTINGTFGSGTGQNAGANPISVVAGDFLGGGSSSLAVALSGADRVQVISLSGFNVGSIPNAIVKADFNADGKLDLATANAGSNDVTILQNGCIAARGNLFDFNRDRRTDFAVYRPLNGFWANQSVTAFFPKVFGRDTDKIVPADYDGDLDTDYAVFRPENGLWIVQANSTSQNSNIDNGSLYFIPFGLPTDIPVPADYDGDRKADIAVWRSADGTFYVRRSSDNTVQSFQFGAGGDKPVPSDYDGDGKADFAVFRPSNGVWYIIRSSDSQFVATQFGISTDQLVPNDYDGDGKTDIGVFRSGVWYYLKSSNGGFTVVNFGTPGDVPVAGDYDADGKFDTAVFRPGNSTWFVLRSSDGTLQTTQYGVATDTPLPSAFVR